MLTVGLEAKVIAINNMKIDESVADESADLLAESEDRRAEFLDLLLQSKESSSNSDSLYFVAKLSLNSNENCSQYEGEILRFLEGNIAALVANYFSVSVLKPGKADSIARTVEKIEANRQGDPLLTAEQIASSVVREQQGKDADGVVVGFGTVKPL
jgi:hypothetical protein